MSDIFRDYSFGGWLREFRLKRNLTLRITSLACGMDAGNYSKLERSELNPPKTKQAIEKIGEGLELTKAELDLLISTAFSFHLGQLKKEFEP